MTNISAGAPGLGQFIAGAAANGGAGIRGGSSAGDRGSWYEAMSRAWGQTLDSQASVITDMSANISSGSDQPSDMVQLTAASLKMQFMSNNAATSQNSVGQALETLGKRN
ncbi:hypothetical protein WCE34_04710 [Luteimonas sp. MJ204]|uniref:hypothetical protein n=1 Tax=Luteimonas TaxID=83614 RepID=UPI0031BA3CAF